MRYDANILYKSVYERILKESIKHEFIVFNTNDEYNAYTLGLQFALNALKAKHMIFDMDGDAE